MIVRQESKCKRIKDSIYIVELSGFFIVKDFFLYFLRSTTLHIFRAPCDAFAFHHDFWIFGMEISRDILVSC